MKRASALAKVGAIAMALLAASGPVAPNEGLPPHLRAFAEMLKP